MKGLAQKTRDTGQDEREEDRARRDGTFRAKVAMQQFVNHNAPLFRAFASAGTRVSEVVDGNVLRDPASDAVRLASLVAARVTGKEPQAVAAADMAPFRTEAASYVAAHWLRGERPDLERAATEIASAASLADAAWDHDAFRDGAVGAEASMAMTAAGVAGTLARAVEVYDFRAGRREVLGRLVRAVAQAASSSAREMLPPGAEAADLRVVTQTLARNLSSLMEACYERRAREVVAFLQGRSPEDRARWLAAHDPVGDVLSSFAEWSLCVGGFAVAATRDMSPERRPDTRQQQDGSTGYRD